MNMHALGWNAHFNDAFQPFAASGQHAARVAMEHRSLYRLYEEGGETDAVLAGKLRHDIELGAAQWPAVGDWVVVNRASVDDRAVIVAVLPRLSAFARRAAGDGGQQVVAANVDLVFIVTAAEGDLNPRRLERYLALAWESGAQPVVLITKADLDPDPDATTRAAEQVALGVPVVRVSSVSGEGVDAVRALIHEGQTAALLGSSGVGKSTLVNALLGEERQRTAGVREDGKGRHTTTHRELIPLGGGLLLDTPGMRELGLWDAQAGTHDAFADVGALAAECRFSDCAHESEPGCAVVAAVTSGRLAAERLESYRKLLAELAYLESRDDDRARAEGKRHARVLDRALHARLREKYQ